MSAATAGKAHELPDPRPVVTHDGRAWRLEGGRCTSYGHPVAHRLPRCPRCRSEVAAAHFGPGGVVWAATVVHVPARAGDRTPFGLAYVDLDHGPRVLARVAGDPGSAAVGTRVRLTAPTEAGDPAVEASP